MARVFWVYQCPIFCKIYAIVTQKLRNFVLPYLSVIHGVMYERTQIRSFAAFYGLFANLGAS